MAQITLPNGQLVNINERGDIINSDNSIFTGGGAPVPVATPSGLKTQIMQRMTGRSNWNDIDPRQQDWFNKNLTDYILEKLIMQKENQVALLPVKYCPTLLTKTMPSLRSL